MLKSGCSVRVSSLSLLTFQVRGSLRLAEGLSVSSRDAKSYLGEKCGRIS